MDELQTLSALALALAGFAWAVPSASRRPDLSRVVPRSLAGQPHVAKRVATQIQGHARDENRFFDADRAPPDVVQRRRTGFMRLASLYAQRFERSAAMTAQARASLTDPRFTGSFRVPSKFSLYARKHLPIGSFLESSSGATLQDIDSNTFYDLAGSCGVNVFGHDFYKACIDEGIDRVRGLGPVLGALHPCVLESVTRLRRLSGLSEVSFHASGTEAVMQAVRLARYHTRRSHLVRFSGASHGWWEDAPPGQSDPLPPPATCTLREMEEKSLKVLRTRNDIACVLVNPLQALHPNAGAPDDATPAASGRQAGFDRDGYTAWLQRVREVCTERAIVLIFDEVSVGFRLARGGAQEYFGIQADMVTYGKTLGGGLPVGVLCGRADLMRRSRDDRPTDICIAQGTFDSHPYVMAAMKAFLDRLETPEMVALYEGLDRCWDERAERFNRALREADLPIRVAHLSSIWSVLYSCPSHYNWMLQFYLHAQGLALGRAGTGQIIFSLNCGEADFDAMQRRFVAAAKQMREDGWWWEGPTQSSQAIRCSILVEMLRRRV